VPAKLDRCVEKVMADGKTEAMAFAICNASMKDEKKKKTELSSFKDSLEFNSVDKTVISVRDGTIKYFGVEIPKAMEEFKDSLGDDRLHKQYTIYRSPATIANLLNKMDGLPITRDHSSLYETVKESDRSGTITDSVIVDYVNKKTDSTIAIKNRVNIDDDRIINNLTNGDRELSLGALGRLIEYEGEGNYDFESVDLEPVHLAVVQKGRCGAECSFLDKKGGRMPDLEKVVDEDDRDNLTDLAKLIRDIPDAIKALPRDELEKALPMLKEIILRSRRDGEKEEVELIEDEDKDKDKDKEEMKDTKDEFKEKEEIKDTDHERREKMADSAFYKNSLRKAVSDAVSHDRSVTSKAREFLGDSYSFNGKSTLQIMREVVKQERPRENFSDSELPLIFKWMQKTNSKLESFGDSVNSSENKFLKVFD